MSEGRPPRPRLVKKGESLTAAEGTDLGWLDGVEEGDDTLDVIGHASGLLIAAADGEKRPAPWLACDLSVMSVPELCTVFLGARQTGVLDVWGSRGRRRLFFENGRYTGAMSSEKEDRLGEVVWREGRISLDQLLIASETLDKGKRIGRYLVELGYLEPRELRGFLRKQAKAVFLAACLEPAGQAFFLTGVRHPNPVRFGAETERLLDEALTLWSECARLEREVEPKDALAKPVVPAPAGARSEAQEALLQLASSAKAPLTRRQLLEKASLGRVHGLRALSGLLTGGYFVHVEQKRKETAAKASRLVRLCGGINAVMELLKIAGAGDGPVREYLRKPPEHLADALSGINVDESLDAEQLELQAQFAEGGKDAMEAGLMILLDFALFEARDTLPPDMVRELQDKVADLEVF